MPNSPTALKPCPFCAGEAYEDEVSCPGERACFCARCGARSGPVQAYTYDGDTVVWKDGAVVSTAVRVAWNTRPGEEALQAALVLAQEENKQLRSDLEGLLGRCPEGWTVSVVPMGAPVTEKS